MGWPQIVVIIWSVVTFVFGLVRFSRAASREEADTGAVVVGVLLYLVVALTFQALLWAGGFYGG